MSREDFARKIRWKHIIWPIAFLYPLTFLPQLISILRSHEVQGVSLLTYSLFIVVQAAWLLDAFLSRNKPLVWTMTLRVGVTAAIVISVLVIRFA